jgi:hypothetical protein
MLEGAKNVPGSGFMTRDPKTGKEMPANRISDLTTKRRRDRIAREVPSLRKQFSGPKVTMDPSVAMERAKNNPTFEAKKGGKVKKSKKPRGCGMASKGVRNARMITMKGS